MKAIVYRVLRRPEVVKVEDIAKPTPADGQLLVKVHAASVNPLDWPTCGASLTSCALEASGMACPKTPVGR